MAVDMFIKIGDIQGESVDAKHKDEIDVLSWSWGMSQSGSAHVGGGMGSGKVDLQDLSLVKYIDKSSPTLMKHCCNGKHIPECSLTIRKAGGTPVEYVTIKLTDVLISSVSTGGSGGEDRLTENVTLNFAKVQVDYQPQDKTGAAAGGAVTMTWNVAENTE